MLLVFVGLCAIACAAPHYHHSSNHYGLRENYFNNDLFDARKFWEDLSKELREFDTMLQDFYSHFPTATSNSGVEGDQYKIQVNLQGFEEKDIVVKAREGLLMIQAVRKTETGNEKSYLDLRTLPANVNVTGSWSYAHGTLSIVFPISGNVSRSQDHVTVPTPADKSREEVEPEGNNHSEIENLDVGTENVEVNEVPRSDIEATTYAVDFNNEVEFVPVKHY